MFFAIVQVLVERLLQAKQKKSFVELAFILKQCLFNVVSIGWKAVKSMVVFFLSLTNFVAVNATSLISHKLLVFKVMKFVIGRIW